MKGLREDCVYRLKVLVLGDKGFPHSYTGVGKTSIILTFLLGQPPKILPPNEDLCFYTKQ